MSDKLPQPTAILIKRLRRIARRVMLIESLGDERRRAYANTCLQAAGRLEELHTAPEPPAPKNEDDKLRKALAPLPQLPRAIGGEKVR